MARSAILIKPASGKSYADTLRSLRAVDPAGNGVGVRSYRQTKDGGIVLRLRSGAGDRAGFKNALAGALGDGGSVRDLTTAAKLEILDLDPATTETEIRDAVREEFDAELSDLHIFQPNKHGACIAVIGVEDNVARRILKKGRLKLGWMLRRVRTRLMVPRCFRCLGYGHYRRDCKGTDRHQCCNRCGQTGHVRSGCTGRPGCFLCAEAGVGETAHDPGCGACGVFRAALKEWGSRTRDG